HQEFAATRALEAYERSPIVTEEGRLAIAACATPQGVLRLSPARLRADGFFIATMERKDA
ncbi:MAG: MFS transporter, partial [Amphiplicatus sp.]